MALIACTECANEVSTTAKTCPKCGAKVTKPSSGEGKWIVGLIVLIVVLVIAMAGNSPPNPEIQAQVSAQRAIEFCWKEQQRKSLSPGSQQFIAGACEKMEDDYIKKYRSRP